MGTQKTVAAPLAELPPAVRAAGLAAPAVILIGPVTELRRQLAWFDALPLFGQRVLVTRPRGQSGALVQRLVELGAAPCVLPAVEITAPENWGPVDAALRGLQQYQWLVFTSANGVEALLDRLPALGLDLRALGGVKLAAIGPKTAAALAARGLTPDLVPARYQSEDLAAELKKVIAPGDRVLLARADRGRELLHDELASHCQVEQLAVYRQVDAVELDESVLERLRGGELDWITLTSANIARSLLGRLDAPTWARIHQGQLKLATISPVTSAAVRALGLPVAAEAATATIEGVLEALTRR
jgi:uroporphyrinogen III methyltransferase/synthase